MTQSQKLTKLRSYSKFLDFLLTYPHPENPEWWDLVWMILEEMLQISTEAITKPKGKPNEKRTRNRKVSSA